MSKCFKKNYRKLERNRITTWTLMWLNWSVGIINTTLQLLDILVANPCDARKNSKNKIFMKHSKQFFLIYKKKKIKSDGTPKLALTYYIVLQDICPAYFTKSLNLF